MTNQNVFIRAAILPLALVLPSALFSWLLFSAQWRPGAALLASVVPMLVCIAVLERVLPFRMRWNRSHGDIGLDAKYTAIVLPLSLVAIALTASGSAAYSPTYGVWPNHWPTALQVLLALVVFELVNYCIHRAQHRIPFLWQFHAIHHAAERLYWGNTLRFHFVDILSKVVFGYGTLFALGINAVTFTYFGLVVLAVIYLQHSNVDVRSGLLNWFIATPELHRWHHSRDQPFCNFGQILIVWDVLFSTRYLGTEDTDPNVGLVDATRLADTLRSKLPS